MKILQLVTVRQRRGAEVFATQLSDVLSMRGHDVVVAGLYPAPPNALTPKHAATVDLQAASSAKLSIRRLVTLAFLLREFRPDVVQANGSETLKYSSLARRLTGSRAPIVYRNISIASRWVHGAAHQWWGRWLARALDHVTSVSEESSRDFGLTYGVPAGRRSVIRRGILTPDQPRTTWARRQLEALTGVSAGEPVLMHTGSFTAEKNHAWLIEAFHRIHATRPDVHLVLLGDGPLRTGIEARVQTLGLQRSVHLLGIRTDAADLVAGADIFVLPSLIEGIPGSLLEAAAQAVPAIATDVGGMREAVTDGQTGILVQPGDSAAFESAALALLSDETRRKAMGISARALVCERFSMDATASGFEKLYTELLCARPHPGNRPASVHGNAEDAPRGLPHDPTPT